MLKPLWQTTWSSLQMLVHGPAVLLPVIDQPPRVLCDAVINTMTKCSSWRGGFIWLVLPCHNASLREVKTGTHSRNLESETEANAIRREILTGLFLTAYSVCFLIPLRTHGVWALPHQPLVKEMPSQMCLQGNLMEALPQLRFLFPRLCQVYKKMKQDGHQNDNRY